MPNVPQQVKINRVINHVDFGLSAIETLPNGEKAINFLIPNGDVLRFQFSEPGVRELIRGLTGGIELPGPNGTPQL